MYKRTVAKTIKEVSTLFPVLLITGIRQVGKSTALKMLSEKRRKYVSLDNLEDRALAKTDPELFLQKYAPPVIIDEIQYVPELFTNIKIYVDSHPANGLFWLTGSQKFRLIEGIQESLAGRVAILDMLGFSNSEKLKKPESVKEFVPSLTWKNSETSTLMKLYRDIFIGSFPRMFINKGKARDIFFKSYIQTYIQRDIKDFYGIHDNLKFYNFLRVVAVRTGNILNISNLSKDAGIDNKTVQHWLNIMERSGLIYLLYPYSNNLTNRIIKTPKIYFLDTGLCIYLAGIDTPKALEHSIMNGSILETYCLCEILKSYWHKGLEPKIYFYRDTDQNEIDFLIEKNMTIYPIEVKKTASPDKYDYANFKVLNKFNINIGTGAVLCLRKEAIPLSKEVVAIPVWQIS